MSHFDPTAREGLPSGWTGAAVDPHPDFAFSDGVRPWNWRELDQLDATQLWALLSSFVCFFNACYGERHDHRIPPCWAEHAALVEELTTLWWARWQAFESAHASIGGAQYWHTYSVPGFLDRMARWIGADRLERCQQGLHEDRDEPLPPNLDAWVERTTTIVALDVVRRPSPSEPEPPKDRNGPRDRQRGQIIQIPFLERE